MENQQLAGWTRYWAQGHAHSCPSSFAGYYGRQTQSFWQQMAAQLTAGQSLLELGCGNAALLAFLARNCPQGQLPRCMGVDAAELAQDKLATRDLPQAQRERITVRGNTLFSALPCPDASIDVLISQYGFEYGDDADTWRELDRVLAPTAQVHLLLHKRNSLLDRIAADEADICAAALAEGGVLDRGALLLPHVAKSHSPQGRRQLANDAGAQRARSAFNQTSQSLQQQAAALGHGGYAEELLQALVARLQDARPEALGAAEAALTALREAVRDQRGRLYALQTAALDDAGIADLARHFQTRGFVVTTPGIIREQGEEFAWSLTARRSQS